MDSVVQQQKVFRCFSSRGLVGSACNAAAAAAVAAEFSRYLYADKVRSYITPIDISTAPYRPRKVLSGIPGVQQLRQHKFVRPDGRTAGANPLPIVKQFL